MAMKTSVTNINVLDIFQDKQLVKVCAPMVRYSKLQFRNLVKRYDCDLMFTPMILADSFCHSEKARQNEFTTNALDSPVIIQFAANTAHDFVGAAYLASPYCNGVDLNCGCPQSWAKEQELGCAMLKKPELIYDLVRQCRNRIPAPFSVSVKIRLLSDITETVEICRQLEKCHISFLNVHARTTNQLTGQIDKSGLKLIKDSCKIPLVANGGVTSLENCFELQDYTGCDGIMVANGILSNPTLFSGTCYTTKNCIQDWLNICYNSTLTMQSYQEELAKPKLTISEKPNNLTFQCFHHHLVFMLEKVLPKRQRHFFNSLKTFSSVLQFIEEYFGLKPMLFEPEMFVKTVSQNMDYTDRDFMYKELKPTEAEEQEYIGNSYNSDGQYFSSKISSEDCDLTEIFLENG
ncbi:dihydrouridine synthase 4 [Leptinotarsa decemlineata]|uniref:dihydrouridine synthase 4 n=1 Tax=Leptinotarsa decemlineata TaxID=7539 RepID=UPI000C253FF1|nr:tRNA-dihydrouridine(20a/20b) synthase [NAD(P)+]-like [Leptinotarsa decemlineata]